MSGGGMESVARPPPGVGVSGGGGGGGGGATGQQAKERCEYYFQMPLHYPKYSKAEYEVMAEWKLDCLLRAYGLPIIGDVNHKRIFAMGAFLWPH